MTTQFWELKMHVFQNQILPLFPELNVSEDIEFEK